MLNNFKNRLNKLEKKESCRTEMVEIEGMKITRLQLQQILKDISGKTAGLPSKDEMPDSHGVINSGY